MRCRGVVAATSGGSFVMRVRANLTPQPMVMRRSVIQGHKKQVNEHATLFLPLQTTYKVKDQSQNPQIFPIDKQHPI